MTELLETLAAEVRRLSPHPVVVRWMRRPRDDRRVPVVIDSFSRDGVGTVSGTELLVDPVLAEAPEGTALYLAAQAGARWGSTEPYPWPPRSGQAAIRRLLATTGDQPYRGTSRQTFGPLSWDRLTRTAAGRRLTPEMAEWLDAVEDTGVYPSWRGRLLVQEHEHEVWPEAPGAAG
ncbi:hypothetical protein [Protaetiibacter intestinalis]|uniref:Uncharacterized protein n=1 Tax=Protaetiibacter intestinalis TaxID=2419774 RepID=A0A387B7U4_9MICO|nr:hypothetical protein [Protaetiibacter intestinalis]AYF97265.1 hypothetical protein D7I47_02700 [Protaetiibacter intestinalis]